MAESDDDLERLFRLEYSPAEPTPSAVGTWSSPRHSPTDIATGTAPPGSAVAAQLARSRELHGGWRWTAEQKQLRAMVKAQRQIGAELDQLTHVGARILHARRAPDSAQPVDHILIGPRGVFVVVDVLTTPERRITWDSSGHLSAGGVSMRLFEDAVVQVARHGVGLAEQMLGDQWRVPVLVVITVIGPSTGAPASTADGISVCDIKQLRTVVDGPYTAALYDETDVACIASAVSRVFPSAAP